MLNHEYSAGAVLYSDQTGERLYVLVMETDGHVGLPKGHMEPGETERQTALREIWEETGVRAQLDADFRYDIQYSKGANCLKHVAVFLARFEDQEISLRQNEVAAVLLLDYETALQRISYSAAREAFRAACAHLNGAF